MEDFKTKANFLIRQELKKMPEMERRSKMRSYSTEKDLNNLLKMFYISYIDRYSHYKLVVKPRKQLRSYEIESALSIDSKSPFPWFIITILLKEITGVSCEIQDKGSYFEWEGVQQQKKGLEELLEKYNQEESDAEESNRVAPKKRGEPRLKFEKLPEIPEKEKENEEERPQYIVEEVETEEEGGSQSVNWSIRYGVPEKSPIKKLLPQSQKKPHRSPESCQLVTLG